MVAPSSNFSLDSSDIIAMPRAVATRQVLAAARRHCTTQRTSRIRNQVAARTKHLSRQFLQLDAQCCAPSLRAAVLGLATGMGLWQPAVAVALLVVVVSVSLTNKAERPAHKVASFARPTTVLRPGYYFGTRTTAPNASSVVRMLTLRVT